MIQLEPVPKCPVCGGMGRLTLSSCQDYVERVQGFWNYRRCQRCSSLWMDPRPREKLIPSLYPTDYYTHARPDDPLKPVAGLRLTRLRFSLKLAALERTYGYRGLMQRAPLQTGWLKVLSRILPGLGSAAHRLVRFVPSRPHGRLLDVGCGNGSFLWLMNELGWNVAGIEPDGRAAHVAASMGFNVTQCGIEDSNLEPSSYDAVTLSHILEHVTDPKAVFNKLVLCLKPGGILVSISPNPVGMLARIFGKNWRALDPPRHLVLLSPRGYNGILGSLGLRRTICTLSQQAGWVCHDSMAIWRKERIDYSPGWLLPQIYGYLISPILLGLLPHSGEEVVCVAYKN